MESKKHRRNQNYNFQMTKLTKSRIIPGFYVNHKDSAF